MILIEMEPIFTTIPSEAAGTRLVRQAVEYYSRIKPGHGQMSMFSEQPTETRTKSMEWNEKDHPRDEKGEFAEKEKLKPAEASMAAGSHAQAITKQIVENLKNFQPDSLTRVSNDDTIRKDASSGPANDKEEKGQGEKKMSTSKFDARLLKTDKGWKVTSGRGSNDPIPDLTDGQSVEIHYPSMGYSVRGTIRKDGRANFSWASPEDKETWIDDAEMIPDPMPTIQDGKIVLPNMSGHAHARRWQKGDIVKVHDAYYKVSAEKIDSRGLHRTFTLVPSSSGDYETRPTRIKVSSSVPEEFVGQAISTKDGHWVQVKKIQEQVHREDGGVGEVVGRTYYAAGNYVSAEKAAQINAKHPSNLNPDKWSNRGDSMDGHKLPEGAKKISTGTHGAISQGTLYVHGDDVYMHHPGHYDDYRETVRKIPGAANELLATVRHFLGKDASKEITLPGGTKVTILAPAAKEPQPA